MHRVGIEPSTLAVLVPHCTCCSCGWSPLNRRVVAQLSLDTVGSPQAGLWSEEGRGRLTVIGLLG